MLHLTTNLLTSYPDTLGGKNSYNTKFISVTTKASWLILVIAAVYQIIIFADITNIIATGCVIFAWGLFTNIFLKPSILFIYPLSTFLILGFVTTQLYFPLLFTSLEGKPVVFNLELPYEVFLHSVLSLFILIIAHTVYRLLFRNKININSNLLIKLGFFDAPVELQLWLMGITGLAATAYVWLYSPSIGWEVTGAASDKVVQALIPFTYAPLFIPFNRLYGGKKSVSTRVIFLLLIYTLLLFAVSIGRNSRGGFMIGFSSVGFAYALGLLLGVYRTRFFTLRNIVLSVVAYLLFTGPIADIGTAMVLVRGQRLDIPYSELMSNTLEAYQDKEAIRLFRLSNIDETERKDWDENYLKNIFLARFCNIKFNDLSLVMEQKIGDQDPRMFHHTINYFLAELPQPLLDFFGLQDVDKVMLKGSSLGDYVYRLAGGPPEVIGWYLTGHFAGIGMITFGWWYLLLLGIGIIPIYLVFDKLFIVNLKSKHSGEKSFRFSMCSLLVLDSIFRFLPFESVVMLATFLLRGWLQLLILYFLMYHITSLISSSLFKLTESFKYP